MSVKKRISLTDEIIEEINNDLEGCDHYEGGCLCGYYEIYIEEIGYITVKTHCRKVSDCPDGMNWFVEDTAYVWDKSVCMLGYVPTEQEALEDDLILLGYLDDYSLKEIKQIIRKDIMANHSWNNTDEYGKQIDYSIEYDDDEVDNSDYNKNTLIKVECPKCGNIGAGFVKEDLKAQGSIVTFKCAKCEFEFKVEY